MNEVQPTDDSAGVLTREKAAAFLRERGYPITHNRLAKLAVLGGGPQYQRWGGRTIYRPESLMAWAKSRASAPVSNTSEAVA